MSLYEQIEKSNRKINALARIAPLLNISKRHILINSFVSSQFKYCPLIWMCHSRANNRKINRLHERYLRIIYNDKQSSFIKLLERKRLFCVYTPKKPAGFRFY